VYGCAYSYLDIELKLIVFLKMNDSDYNNSLFIIQTAIYTRWWPADSIDYSLYNNLPIIQAHLTNWFNPLFIFDFIHCPDWIHKFPSP